MKILLVNYRYFVSGGPEKYMFNVKRALEEQGHEIIPFSVHSNKNVETEYSSYFVEPIGGRDLVYFEDYKKIPKTILKMITRSVYSLEVKKAIQKEIRDVKPDLVYIIHFVNKLSPSVITGAKEMGVPVVLRLSDFFLLCPRFDFLSGTSICEDCLSKGYGSCIKKRCVKGSLAASLIRVFGMKVHQLMNVYKDVDAFVTPSLFLKEKLAANGFDRNKIHHIPTFTTSVTEETRQTVGNYGLYFGRIEVEKGVDTVVRAYELLKDHKAVIMGDDTSEEGERLKKYVKDKGLTNIIRNARFVMIPSIWYDNLPNTALESFNKEKPVIASNLGSLPELVNDGENGFLIDPYKPEELAEAVKKLDDDELVLKMGKCSKDILKKRFSKEAHLKALVELFESVEASCAE